MEALAARIRRRTSVVDCIGRCVLDCESTERGRETERERETETERERERVGERERDTQKKAVEKKTSHKP